MAVGEAIEHMDWGSASAACSKGDMGTDCSPCRIAAALASPGRIASFGRRALLVGTSLFASPQLDCHCLTMACLYPPG